MEQPTASPQSPIAQPYWTKQTTPLYQDLTWNFPEQKQGTVSVVGGHSASFAGVAKLSAYLAETYPIAKVETYLPDALKSKLPPLPGLNFVPSTESGSLAKSPELNRAFTSSDFALLAGDLSKNSATTIAIASAIKTATCPVLLARDAVDTITPEISALIEDHQLFLLASMAQLQKLFRSLLYPKMLLLAQPLLPALETLHKFTLSYENTTIITYHEGHIIIANQGKIITTPLTKTNYNPLTLFTTNLPADLVAYNLWNPQNPLEASAAALLTPNSGKA